MEPLKCQHCQTQLNSNDETLERELTCPSCGSRTPLGVPIVSRGKTTRTTVAHFKLLEEVGKGQFGAVWRARDTQLDRIVALKIPRRDDLDPHTRRMFLREANAAASLNHPNIVHIHSVIEEVGAIYIVSEFINGDNLKLCLSNGIFPTHDDVAKVMIDIAEAVHHAHEHGIIHRDLKPANILVDGNRQPHLTDFGLAKVESLESTMTVYGDQPVGTLSYMSPEQAGGSVHELDRRSDVFSLGVMLYEMLTGQRPFPGVSFDILDKIRNTEPIPLRRIKKDLPRDLEAVCLKALAKDPGWRYATARELAEDLRCCREGKPTHARPIPRLEKANRWLRKNVALAAVSLVAFFSMAAAAMELFPSPGGHQVELTTSPPNAEVVLRALDPATGELLKDRPIHAGRSPISRYLPPGDYLVIVKLDDGRFHEVYRHVPYDPSRHPEAYPHRNWRQNAQGHVTLPLITIPERNVTQGMTAFAGKSNLAAFELDPHEVTIDEFRKWFDSEVPGAMRSKDEPRSGRYPLTGTLFDYAMWYAELVGKRLPTRAEFEFAMTNSGTTRYPWGQEARSVPWEFSPVGSLDFDATATVPAVRGLFSNGAEFTSTPFTSEPSQVLNLPSQRKASSRGASHVPLTPLFDMVVVCGGPCSKLDDLADVEHLASRGQIGMPRKQLADHVGFRCARSVAPQW